MRGITFILTFIYTLSASGQSMSLKRDESITFYPSIAHSIEGGWRIEIHGLVFEPEKRDLSLWMLREALDLRNIEFSAEEQRIFNDRARLFLRDHERRKQVIVRFNQKAYRLGRSQTDGSFKGDITLMFKDGLENGLGLGLTKHPTRPSEYFAALSSDDSRRITGEVLALDEIGLSVISDIDDTIKITEVRDRNATLRNTFLREFQPVPGMAEFYQHLARERGAQFHYISASPWQLYEPLAAFVETNGFPRGTFELKAFRWKSRNFFSLFANPEKYKPGVIEPLLRQFPKRRFILIGDSGERDPEIYASLARKYPRQIEHIYIRDVTTEAGTADRYVKAFRDVPRERWQVFREPSEIKLPVAR